MRAKEWTVEKVEQYMIQHQFLEADKKKVRDFLRLQRATDAHLTRTNLHYISCGIPSVISRSLLGLQDNFV